MPSDTARTTPTTPATHRDPALDILRAPGQAFRSAVVSMIEELQGMLDEHHRSSGDGAKMLSAELGPFAAGRVDPGRLAALVKEKGMASPAAVPVIERAMVTLSDAVAAADGRRLGPEGMLFEAHVPDGGDLRDAVRDTLTRAGRVFGAARAADLARTGRFRPEHESLFTELPFRSWTLRERRIAPPVVVRVGAADLRPSGLGDFLDGSMKIVLVVEGSPAPAAALARLISPSVFVVQTGRPDGLEALLDFDGPGVGALFATATADVPDIVRFVHDPRSGSLPWERVHLEDEPDAVRRAYADRRWKDRSWAEDLEHLVELTTAPAGGMGVGGVTDANASGNGAGAPGATGSASPEAPRVSSTDRLAAWLLANTDLDGS